MWNEFPSLLCIAEEDLLDRWVERLLAIDPWMASRGREALRRQAAAILRLVQGMLGGGAEAAAIAPAPADSAGAGLAPAAARGVPEGAASLLVCLAGLEVVHDEVLRRLAGAARERAEAELLRAFHLAASQLATAACRNCLGLQVEQRAQVERQLAALVARGEDAMVLLDGELAIQSWNPAAERTFRHPATAVLGRPLPEVLGLDAGADAWLGRALAELRRRGVARASGVRWAGQDGAVVWLDVSFTSVLDASHEPMLHWAVFRDVGKSRQMEEEKLQAERLALIGTMSAKLAHEVRNPLNSILLGLDLLRDDLAGPRLEAGASSEELRSLLASVESEVERIQRVVDDYLRFARLPHVELRRVEFDAFLRRHLELIEPEAARQHARLEVRLAAPGARVALDEGQLWQVLLNLVRNALEAMPAGGSLGVTTRLAGGQLVCEVWDTGSGMTREARENLFRPFFSTKPTGTGLGLALARQILAEHGAAVECESEPGRGTRFRLTFPEAVAAERAAERLPAERALERLPAGPGSPLPS
jgi:PAS domain S-box-containing protein